MIYPGAFHFFDPQKGQFPHLFSGHFQYIAEKARIILEKRSNEEIENAFKTIIRIINIGRSHSFDDWIDKTDGEEQDFYEKPVFYLKQQIDSFNISQKEPIKNATWQEYFAILALALIGHAKTIEKVKHPHWGRTQKENDELNHDLIANCLADAFEAVDFAQSLIDSEKDLKKEMKALSKRATDARYNKNREIKNQFVSFWKTGKHTIRFKAAADFYHNLSESHKRILSRHLNVDRAIRNLLTHLRDYEHNKIS